MKRNTGFTLIEIMLVLAILAILSAMAMPAFKTWQYRAYGTEATFMAKQILDAQITYFLENDRYFPDAGPPTILIAHNYDPNDPNILDIRRYLDVTFPAGHRLDYSFTADNTQGNELFILQISSVGGFNIAKGTDAITYTLDREGKIENLTF